MSSFAYADPPYLGCAKRYKGGKEVNSRLLVAHLEEHDGWALSCNPTDLRVFLPLAPLARVLAWCKPYSPSRPNVQPVYAWEAVVLRRIPRRTGKGRDDWQRDWLVENPSGMTGGRGSTQRILGEKPPAFCFWLFLCAGLNPEDDFLDVFPGSGAVTQAWENWRQRDRPQPLELDLGEASP